MFSSRSEKARELKPSTTKPQKAAAADETAKQTHVTDTSKTTTSKRKPPAKAAKGLFLCFVEQICCTLAVVAVLRP